MANPVMVFTSRASSADFITRLLDGGKAGLTAGGGGSGAELVGAGAGVVEDFVVDFVLVVVDSASPVLMTRAKRKRQDVHRANMGECCRFVLKRAMQNFVGADLVYIFKFPILFFCLE